jgi:hypothetical protein
MNTTEIQQNSLLLHNALGKRADTENKAAFDAAHSKIWTDCDQELKTRKALLEANANPTQDEKRELITLQTIFPTLPLFQRDLAKEIDELKSKIAAIKLGK